MTWTDPSDYSTGQLISAAIWNALIGATGNLASHTAGGVVTTAGDTIYATGDNAVSRLAKGTARQTLAMNSGASAPEWAASSRSVLTTAGDVMYASGTNTPARLAKGTGRQNLTMNSGATAPEWTASPASTLTAKADVLSASAANTPARLAVGANDTVLTAASGESTGLKWAAAAGGGGKILQVQHMTYTTRVDNNTDTFVATGLTDAITPANTANKILVMGSVTGAYKAGNVMHEFRMTKGGSNLIQIVDMHNYSNTTDRMISSLPFFYVDSPSSTSALTYAIEFRSYTDAATISVQQDGTAASMSFLVLMEIDGT